MKLNNPNYLNGLNSSASEIDAVVDDFYILPLTDDMIDTDITLLFQEAINNYKNIYLFNAGSYSVSNTLLVPSNRIVWLSDTVTIKNTSSKYMVSNEDMVNRNTNITIIGGTWDCNSQLATGSYPIMYPGHNFFFHKCDNITFKDITFKNSKKYASLVVDCTNFNASNIHFDTLSDGLHFMPPLKNVLIDGVYGKTGDDMVAFTLGDYQSYQVSNIGNFEDIVIRNVFADGAKAILKITGSGEGSAYSFKNIILENTFGNCKYSPVAIIDDPVGGTNLINTKLINIKLKNIFTSNANNYPTVSVTTTGGGDLTLDCVYGMGTSKAITTSSTSYLNNLNINNIGILNNAIGSLTQIELAGNIDNLSIDKGSLRLNNANFCKTVATHKTLKISKINVVGNDLSGDRLIDFRGSLATSLKICDCDIEKMTYLVYSNVNLNVTLSDINAYNSSLSNTLLYASAGNMYIKGVNVLADNAIGATTGTGTLRIDCKDLNVKNVTKVTGQKGDELSILGVRKRHDGTSFVDI